MAAQRPIFLSCAAIDHNIPAALTKVISLYARAHNTASFHLQKTIAARRDCCQIQRYSCCLPTSHNTKLMVHMNLCRFFSDSGIKHKNDARGDRRRALKSGRVRRKRKLKREEESIEKDDTTTTTIHKNNVDDGTKDTTKNAHDDDILKDYKRDDDTMIFGIRIPGNPIRERYIESQRKINYPKTWSGWKTVMKRTWDTYLWTFEGFLLAEKKRDADGNIIPDDTKEESDDDKEEDKTLQDKATDAAEQISQNVQKNISTIKEEAPKLVQMGQQLTGISTREELREWVSEQLKLGTTCLSEFMKGYKKGRDQEIDRMLHEYF